MPSFYECWLSLIYKVRHDLLQSISQNLSHYLVHAPYQWDRSVIVQQYRVRYLRYQGYEWCWLQKYTGPRRSVCNCSFICAHYDNQLFMIGRFLLFILTLVSDILNFLIKEWLMIIIKPKAITILFVPILSSISKDFSNTENWRGEKYWLSKSVTFATFWCKI